MLVIDDTIFLHLYKCAGTSIGNTVELARKDDIQFVSTHNPLHNVPIGFRTYKAITVVRNPLTWYVSWYNWATTKMKSFRDTYNKFDFLLRDKEEIIDIHTFINRATDLPLFFRENPIELSDFKTTLLSHRTSPWFKAIIGDLTKFTVDNMPSTLYQLLVFGIGVQHSTTYKMETELSEVFKILKLDTPTQKFSKDNVSSGPIKLMEEDLGKILQADNILFEIFGYKKELL